MEAAPLHPIDDLGVSMVAEPGSGSNPVVSLNKMLSNAGMANLAAEEASAFAAYLALLLRWNAHTNLTAIRDEDGILRRHFVESIFCARSIPGEVASLLDFGSGAGFPGIPVALLRRGIAVTLAESQSKKAAFLREAARVLEVGFVVHGGRAEEITEVFDCVTMRAVDHMPRSAGVGARLVAPGGWMAIFTTQKEKKVHELSAGVAFRWSEPLLLPYSDGRLLLLGNRER